MTATRLIGQRLGPLHRMVPTAEFRATPDGVEGRFTAKVLNYNVLDDYDTEFAPGLFRESMDARMPRIVWGHDWRQVLGRWTQYKDTKDSLTLTGEFDDFDHVPMARQAFHQLQSGTIDQFSVGFVPTEWEDRKVEGKEFMVRRFTRGRLDEVSLVLMGAVPGTELLAVRSGGLKLHVREPLIPKEKAADVLLRLHTGELDLADALQAIKSMPAEGDTENDPDVPPKAADEPKVGDGGEPPADPPAAKDDDETGVPAAADGTGEPADEPEVDDEAAKAAAEAEQAALDAEMEAALALVDGLA